MPRLDKSIRFRDSAGESNSNGKGDFSPYIAQEKQPERKKFIDLIPYLREPKYSFEDFIFPTEKTKRQAERVLAEIQNHHLIYNVWRMAEKHKSDTSLGINCHGPSGTGKSMLLECLANAMKLKVLEVPSTSSKYVGVTEQIIQEIFSFAATYNAFIVWNEADRDFGKRLDEVSQSADVGINSARSILIEQVSAFKGVIGLTTNKPYLYDSALSSRIRLQIQFDLPDAEARAKIWQAQIPSQLPLDESVDLSQLAAKFSEVSGRDIKKAVLNAVVTAASEEKPGDEKRVTQSHFIQAMEEVIAGNKAAEKAEVKLTPVSGNIELPSQPSATESESPV